MALSRWRSAIVLVCLAMLTSLLLPAAASIKGITITSRAPWSGAATSISAARYEKIEGNVLFAIDPTASSNAAIADVRLAPRDADGLVEFSSKFVMLRPLRPVSRRRSIVLEVLNRGHSQANGLFFSTQPGTTFKVEALERVKLQDAFLLEQGFAVVWLGWQFDLSPNMVGLKVPVAAVHSVVREAFTPDDDAISTGVDPLEQGSYCAADAEQPAATMSVKTRFDGPAKFLPRSSWSFAHVKDGRDVPDPCSIHAPGLLKKGSFYEFVYQAAAAPVAGLGFAALRDFVSYLKYGGVPSPLAGRPKNPQHVIGFGYSQSARFLRQYLYQGFTADEAGRKTFDAMFIASAGAGRGSFNHRYALPSEAGNSVLSDLRPVDLFPFTDDDEKDMMTGSVGGLLDKAKATGTVPKIFYTFSSSEYWSRFGSLTYTSVDGSREIGLDPRSRLYYFAGTAHAPASFPPSRTDDGTKFSNDVNFASKKWAFRALLLDLEGWTTDGVAPPPSVYPHLGKDLVSRNAVKFPAIPGLRFPGYMPQNWRMDFGPDFISHGIIAKEPPDLGEPYAVRVPQVDADGNDLGGIELPFRAVPLGTYTGWNHEGPNMASFGYLAGMYGGFQPFAMTKIDRIRTGDERRSIEERYRDRSDYLANVRTVSADLVRHRFMRPEDVGEAEQEAATYWDGIVGAASSH